MRSGLRVTTVAIVCVAALCLAGPISGRWQAGPPGDLEIVWSKQQPHPLHYLEEKAALSPDGTAVAYVTPNGDLILSDIPSAARVPTA